MTKLPPYSVKKSDKNFDIGLQAEMNGEMKTIHTVRCPSEEERTKMIKGLGDWAAQIDANARSKI